MQKNKTVSLSKAQSVAVFHELFNLPVSVEAFTQMQKLEFELLNLEPSDLNDTWTYIWDHQFSQPLRHIDI